MRVVGPPWSAHEVNVLSQEKKQQVLTLGRLGWSLREIEEAVHVRRETASGYLKAAGIAVRGPRKRRAPKPASGEGVSTDSGESDGKSGQSGRGVHRLRRAKPGTGSEAVRAVPRADRASGAARSEREDHLAGPRHRSWLPAPATRA